MAVGCGVAANWLLKPLQAGYGVDMQRRGTHHDIVLLGAGSQLTPQGPELAIFSYGRLVKAFELYRECKAHALDCHIISSGGGDTRGYGISEAELYTAALVQLGAAPEDLSAEKQSLNTWQNAQFTAEILKRHAGGAVVLVSSGVHLRRSELYFAHFGVRGQAVRGDYAQASVSLLPSAYHFLLTDLVLHEHVGVLRYHVYNFFGWNVKAVQPGAL